MGGGGNSDNIERIVTSSRVLPAACLLLLAFAPTVLAQSPPARGSADAAAVSPPTPIPTVASRDAAGNVTLRAFPLVEGLVVDGRLDEATYQEVEPAADFIP